LEMYNPRWVIEGILARSARPGRDLGAHALVPKEKVDSWLAILRQMGIRSILCLLDEKHLQLYPDLPGGLIAYYRQQGFQVAHLPIRDPAYYPRGWEELEENLALAWEMFKELPWPVLVHCSAGVDRTGRVVEYVLQRLEEEHTGSCQKEIDRTGKGGI